MRLSESLVKSFKKQFPLCEVPQYFKVDCDIVITDDTFIDCRYIVKSCCGIDCCYCTLDHSIKSSKNVFRNYRKRAL